MMVKKMISVATAFLMLCCMVPFYAFAETISCPKCGKDTLTTNQDISVEVGEEVGLPLSLKRAYCSNCHYVKYEYNILGVAGEQAYDDGDQSHIINYLNSLKAEMLGKNATAQKIDATNGGANIPAAGGRNPKGYGDEGKPNVNSSGASCIWVEPFGITWGRYRFRQSAPSECVTGSSQSGVSWPYTNVSICPQYYFTAPVSGLYFVGSYGSPYDFGTFSYFNNNKWNLQYLTANFTVPYVFSISLKKGETCYFGFEFYDKSYSPGGHPYKFSLNKIPIYIEPLGDSSITTTNNITINNNTWNGNIYTDNSTNLTYIYPQYTTINEKNETVTNISNTPIIYNNETKQYYTYDQTTKNYYYITYNAQPTPSPSPNPAPSESPAPAPTPDPGTTPTPTPKPGGSISTPETGRPGGSSGSGQSWWDKLPDKIGNAVIDGLLGAVSAVLKLIFKLFSTILGWIIWAVSLVFTLFPFLPPGVSGLLVGGVVVCFIIGIIKFIRG